MSLQLYMLVLSILTSVSISAQKSPIPERIDSHECKEWVDSVYHTLSTQERIAQLIMVNTSPSQGESSRAELRTLIGKYQVGGLFFSKGSAAQMAEMTNYAQSLAKVPLLMGIDGEWGPAMRVTDAPVFPYNMNLGAIQNTALIFEMSEEVARECRELGVQMDFAPVLDVNSNPSNPVIGRRSYGEDPLRVAKAGHAFMLGLESGGVLAVAKHFPGHGDTDADSHKTLPTVGHSVSDLQSIDLVPFRDFINSGGSGVMVAHLSVPSLDNPGLPSSMSKKVVTDLLKDKLGFKGLVITDALNMKGAAVTGNVCVQALKAGNDILLSPTSLARDIPAIEAALASGELKEQVIEERCKKILAYKYAVGLNHKPKQINASAVAGDLNTPKAQALIQRLANASITVVRNTGDLLPLKNLGKTTFAIVNIGAPAENAFSDLCRRYDDVDVYGSAESNFTPAVLEAINRHDVVVAAVYNDNQAARNTIAALKKSKGFVPVFFIGAYKMAKFKSSVAGSQALVAAYDNSPYLQRAAAMALFGGIEVSGRMPVNVEGVASLGEGVDLQKTRLGFASPAAVGVNPELTARVDSAMRSALAKGAFPGAQVLVAKDGEVIIDRCYGTNTKGGEKVTPETIYDLASVSKTIGTLPGVMKAYDMDLFDLDTPASKYVAGLNVEGKSDLTPRMLLYHETGLPAALDIYTFVMDPDSYTGRVVTGKRDKNHTVAINGGGFGSATARLRPDLLSKTRTGKFTVPVADGLYAAPEIADSIMGRIYNSKTRPERKSLYSCLNFCLLMDMEQRVTGKDHYSFVDEQVWEPLGATSLSYNPLDKYSRSQIAATENDTYLRRQHISGYVHDETAAFSGGVQGNAGVFGNATDIAKICQMWLNGGEYGGERILSEATTNLFTKDKSPNSNRGLGFDKPNFDNPSKSPVSPEASPATYGHTGFTGTCFWVDPQEQLIFVFLSNRIDPTRKTPAFWESNIRTTLMSLVYQAIEHP